MHLPDAFLALLLTHGALAVPPPAGESNVAERSEQWDVPEWLDKRQVLMTNVINRGLCSSWASDLDRPYLVGDLDPVGLTCNIDWPKNQLYEAPTDDPVPELLYKRRPQFFFMGNPDCHCVLPNLGCEHELNQYNERACNNPELGQMTSHVKEFEDAMKAEREKQPKGDNDNKDKEHGQETSRNEPPVEDPQKSIEEQVHREAEKARKEAKEARKKAEKAQKDAENARKKVEEMKKELAKSEHDEECKLADQIKKAEEATKIAEEAEKAADEAEKKCKEANGEEPKPGPEKEKPQQEQNADPSTSPECHCLHKSFPCGAPLNVFFEQQCGSKWGSITNKSILDMLLEGCNIVGIRLPEQFWGDRGGAHPKDSNSTEQTAKMSERDFQRLSSELNQVLPTVFPQLISRQLHRRSAYEDLPRNPFTIPGKDVTEERWLARLEDMYHPLSSIPEDAYRPSLAPEKQEERRSEHPSATESSDAQAVQLDKRMEDGLLSDLEPSQDPAADAAERLRTMLPVSEDVYKLVKSSIIYHEVFGESPRERNKKFEVSLPPPGGTADFSWILQRGLRSLKARQAARYDLVEGPDAKITGKDFETAMKWLQLRHNPDDSPHVKRGDPENQLETEGRETLVPQEPSSKPDEPAKLTRIYTGVLPAWITSIKPEDWVTGTSPESTTRVPVSETPLIMGTPNPDHLTLFTDASSTADIPKSTHVVPESERPDVEPTRSSETAFPTTPTNFINWPPIRTTPWTPHAEATRTSTMTSSTSPRVVLEPMPTYFIPWPKHVETTRTSTTTFPTPPGINFDPPRRLNARGDSMTPGLPFNDPEDSPFYDLICERTSSPSGARDPRCPTLLPEDDPKIRSGSRSLPPSNEHDKREKAHLFPPDPWENLNRVLGGDHIKTPPDTGSVLVQRNAMPVPRDRDTDFEEDHPHHAKEDGADSERVLTPQEIDFWKAIGYIPIPPKSADHPEFYPDRPVNVERTTPPLPADGSILGVEEQSVPPPTKRDYDPRRPAYEGWKPGGAAKAAYWIPLHRHETLHSHERHLIRQGDEINGGRTKGMYDFITHIENGDWNRDPDTGGWKTKRDVSGDPEAHGTIKGHKDSDSKGDKLGKEHEEFEYSGPVDPAALGRIKSLVDCIMEELTKAIHFVPFGRLGKGREPAKSNDQGENSKHTETHKHIEVSKGTRASKDMAAAELHKRQEGWPGSQQVRCPLPEIPLVNYVAEHCLEGYDSCNFHRRRLAKMKMRRDNFCWGFGGQDTGKATPGLTPSEFDWAHGTPRPWKTALDRLDEADW